VKVDPEGAVKVPTIPDRFRVARWREMHVNAIENAIKNVAQIMILFFNAGRVDFLEQFFMCLHSRRIIGLVPIFHVGIMKLTASIIKN